MPAYTNLLEEALEAWSDARLGALAEVENIPAEQWDFRPTEDVRSVREMVVHILEVAMFMTGELTRPDTDFRRLPMGELVASYAQPAYATASMAPVPQMYEEGVRWSSSTPTVSLYLPPPSGARRKKPCICNQSQV